MFTNERLTETYAHAPIKYFDEHSKFIIFSDMHRGDDSISDEFSRNHTLMLCALQYYYLHGYIYIEAGDGDELWENNDFKYIRTAHSDIFTLLKAFFQDHRFIMLYGNHNIFLKSPTYVASHYYHFYDLYKDQLTDLFKGIRPLEGLVLKHRKTGQKILVVHGHQGDLFNDQLWPINMFFLRYLWRFIHVIGFKNPSTPARTVHFSHKLERKYTKWIKENKISIICGHTHRMRFPKKGQLPYFNTGSCIHSKGLSGIEIINDKIMTVQWRLEADSKGYLKVARYIIRGPEPLSQFTF